jgi:hypothetical protein
MRFARIEGDDHAFMLEIDFHIFHSGNTSQHRSQFPHALIAILAFSSDFDRFQNCVIGAFREKRISRIGISRSCGVYGVLIFLSNV